ATERDRALRRHLRDGDVHHRRELAASGTAEAATPGSVARGRPRLPGKRDDREGPGREPGARVRAVRGGGKARPSGVDPGLEDQGTGDQEGAVQGRVTTSPALLFASLVHLPVVLAVMALGKLA